MPNMSVCLLSACTIAALFFEVYLLTIMMVKVLLHQWVALDAVIQYCDSFTRQFVISLLISGAGTIFQQGGQEQLFPAGGLGAL